MIITRIYQNVTKKDFDAEYLCVTSTDVVQKNPTSHKLRFFYN